jgi:hypothetical protein
MINFFCGPARSLYNALKYHYVEREKVLWMVDDIRCVSFSGWYPRIVLFSDARILSTTAQTYLPSHETSNIKGDSRLVLELQT